MSNLEDHEAEQAEITAACEAGECDHEECGPKIPNRKRFGDLWSAKMLSDYRQDTAISEALVNDANIQPQDEPATGMRCPSCGNTERFIILTQRWAMHTAEGDDPDHEDLPDHDSDWDEYAACRCPECPKTGIVQEFQV